MDPHSFVDLRRRIELAWSKETTFCEAGYEIQDPAYGQCGVTSVYVFDCYGGGLMQGTVRGDPHYFNCFSNGILDFTWRQFPLGSQMTDLKWIKREDILPNDWFRQRYNNFVRRMW